jgi:hypothetical protein
VPLPVTFFYFFKKKVHEWKWHTPIELSIVSLIPRFLIFHSPMQSIKKNKNVVSVASSLNAPMKVTSFLCVTHSVALPFFMIKIYFFIIITNNRIFNIIRLKIGVFVMVWVNDGILISVRWTEMKKEVWDENRMLIFIIFIKFSNSLLYYWNFLSLIQKIRVFFSIELTF